MSIPFLDNIDMKNNLIVNLGTPINDTDGANKIYVDSSLASLKINLENQLNTQRDELTNLITTDIEALNIELSNRITTVEQSIVSTIDSKIVDNLDTPSGDYALSANQGAILKSLIEVAYSDNNIYSSEPTLIGTWLDSSVYRIVIDHICDETTAQDVLIDIPYVSNYSVPINVYGYYKTEDGKISWFGKHKNAGNTDGVYVVDYDTTTYQLNLYLAPNVHALAANGLTLSVVVEYAEILELEEPVVPES